MAVRSDPRAHRTYDPGHRGGFPDTPQL